MDAAGSRSRCFDNVAGGGATLARAKTGPRRINEQNRATIPGHMKMAARAALLLLLASWTVAFLARPMRQDVIGSSFLHVISIPFHEAGHVLFAPFGRVVMVMGGSLGQVLVPAICAIAFLTTSFDPFAAVVCVWWAGENLLDVAVYIDDARALKLVLLGGHTGAEVEGHDWEYLLQQFGALHLDHRIAWTVHWIGAAAMIGGLAAGTWMLLTSAGPEGPARSEANR
jgi:hypothetical protein